MERTLGARKIVVLFGVDGLFFSVINWNKKGKRSAAGLVSD
jgi:hypothetical protein